jgi:hypothetical protein
MPHRVSQPQLIRDAVPLFSPPPLLIRLHYIAGSQRPATRRRATGSRTLCYPNHLFSPLLCCRRPDGQIMVSGNVARDCLSECSARELWVAPLATELTKCHPSLAGVTRTPGVRSWRFLDHHLLLLEEWMGEDFWLYNGRKNIWTIGLFFHIAYISHNENQD